MDHSIKSLSLKFMILALDNESKSKYYIQSNAIAAFKNTLKLINESNESSKNFSESLFYLINEDLENGSANNIVNNFHKSFRQMDMTNSGHLDMIVWNLLQIEDVFRKFEYIVKYLLEIVKKNKFLMKDNEIEKDYINRLVNDYELYFV